MGEQVIDSQVRSAASPDDVYAALADVSCWPLWGIWSRAEIERPGADSPQGPGAIRVLVSRSFGRTIVNRELVTEAVPGALFAYELLSGLPLRHYRGRVELTPDGDGTVIRWTSRFDRATPGLTWLYRRFFERFIPQTAERLARYAERDDAAA